MLVQRPAPRRQAPPVPQRRGWSAYLRATLGAFTTQVLLRPVRIGTLALLGAMIAVVTVGAEGWWVVLGIVLFQAAAGALTVMWIDPTQVRLALAPAGPPPPTTGTVLIEVPEQRRPGPGE